MFKSKMYFECGRLVHKSIIREIRSYCFTRNIECKIDIDKGWITCCVYIVMSGEQKVLNQAHKDIYSWAKEWE